MTTTRNVRWRTLNMTKNIGYTTSHLFSHGHSYHHLNRCPGRVSWISCRCDYSSQNGHHHPSRLRTEASRRRLHCTRTLPVDTYHWVRHRSWMTSTRPSTRGLWTVPVPPPSVGKAGNWLEGGFYQDRARNRHQWIQTQLCSQPMVGSSRKCSQYVGERWSIQIPRWLVQDLTGSVLLC